MSWEDQRRQDHGWFGSGKAEATNGDSPGSDQQSLDHRMDAVIYGSIAALPRALRAGAALRLDPETRAQLNALMITRSRGGSMDQAEFAGQFFGRNAGDPVVTALHTAALTAGMSAAPEALRDAAEHLASAMETIGLDRWHQFLDDAQVRSNARSTIATLKKSNTPADPRSDAIRPVYPLETAIGVAAAGIACGAAAAGRPAGTALLRQLLPGQPPAAAAKPGDAAPPPKPESTLDIVAPGGKPVGTIFGRAGTTIRTVTEPEFRTIESRLLKGATPIKKPGYLGTWYKPLDGSLFGIKISPKI